MSRIQWGSFGTRIIESGVDRGVFYPNVGPGLPWNGLINVKEDPSGTELAKIFVDGTLMRTQKTRESFAAVLQAYTSPREFDDYDGNNDQQRRKAFGLSYRTGISNDISADYGHKIHLVYNALAMPSQVGFSTTASDGLDAAPFSWGISTTPVPIPGAKPAAHLIIDTTLAHPDAVQAVEDILYGSIDGDPRLPDPEELMDVFEQHAIFVVIDHGDGTWTATGPDEAFEMLDADTFQITWPSIVYLDEDTYQISST